MAGFLPAKIVSGGQTGVDRAGLDAALERGLPIGGYIPKGARAEDGRVPRKYGLTETKSSDYFARTVKNVEASDATLILYFEEMTGGTLLTCNACLRLGKPVLCVDLLNTGEDCTCAIREFLNEVRPRVLNIAGPRESKTPGVYSAALRILRQSFIRAA